MMKQTARLGWLLQWALALSLWTGCRSAVAVRPAPPLATAPVHLTLVGTNDLHGWLLEQSEGALRFGGLPLFASYLDVLREENPGGVLLVDAGDLFQGTLVSNLSEGAVVMEALNWLRYDAASIGNHDFDYGPVGPSPSATEPSMDPFGALRARIAQAHFPLLSSNIYEKATGQRPAWLPGDGTLLVERRGLRIGLVGLTTPQTPYTTLPINVASLEFRPLASEALRAAQDLRARGADVVVALVHAGGRCHAHDDAHALDSCDVETGEVFEMLRGIPEGTLDAVVAGHTHARIGHFVRGTPVVQSWALGRAFGVIDLLVDPISKRVLPEHTRIASGIEVCETVDAASGSCDPKAYRAHGAGPVVPATFHGRPVAPDPTLLARLQPAVDAVAATQNRPLGVDVPRRLQREYEGESPLGSLMADTLRAMTKADVALLNPGGLRADLHEGPLTYGRVYEVFPFDNHLATLDVSGDQLRKLLAAAYGARKGVFQVSGLEVTLRRCPAPDRLKAVVLTGGRAVDAKHQYRVVLPDFLARGGDGLATAVSTLEHERVDLGDRRARPLRDELIEFWRAKGTPLVAPRSGRVTFVDASATCAASAHGEAIARP